MAWRTIRWTAWLPNVYCTSNVRAFLKVERLRELSDGMPGKAGGAFLVQGQRCHAR